MIGLAAKSVGVLTVLDETAYRTPDGSNVSMLSDVDGAATRLDALSTLTYSYRLLPDEPASPSTS